jgi:hypothetical protein
LVWFETPDETRWISIRHCTAKTVTGAKGGNQVPGEDVEKPGTTEKAVEKAVPTDKAAGSARKRPRPQATEVDEQEVDTKAAGAGDEEIEPDDTSVEPASDGGSEPESEPKAEPGSVNPPRVEQHSAAGHAPGTSPKESAPSAKETPLTRHTVGMMRFRRKKSRKRR